VSNKVPYLQTDGQTDKQTDRQTDTRTTDATENNTTLNSLVVVKLRPYRVTWLVALYDQTRIIGL